MSTADTRLQVLRIDRWLIEALVILLLGSLAASAALEWHDANVNQGHVPAALDDGGGPRPAGGFLKLSAPVLNKRQPWRADLGRNVSYVPATEASTGPWVVSVNPINASTWAAVSLGTNGRCYAELDTTNAAGYGGTFYATFASGAPCKASSASRATVRSTDYPSS